MTKILVAGLFLSWMGALFGLTVRRLIFLRDTLDGADFMVSFMLALWGFF